MKYLLHILIFVFLFSSASAEKGKLLLIGGGPENISTTTSWNYEAFNWAVEQSANKKVALIHYSTNASSDFEDYFIDYCGADAVKSFIVSSSTANSSALINEISEYDVFYFRGGDQWQYYDAWKGKLMETAIHSKYNNGGVICGTSAGLAILSGVMFSAEYNSAYSNLCIKNTNHITIKLENNFLEMMPGFIFDSHFTERGRMGRLISFMAHWKKNNGESIVGIGVDEITALAVNSDLTATAYGAGTVNIYKLRDGVDYKTGTVLNVDSLEVTQLIQGATIDLNTLEVGGYSQSIESTETTETFSSKIYASGGDELNETNIAMLTEFVQDGSETDQILILTESKFDISSDYKSKLEDLGAKNIKIYIADNTTADDENLKNDIESSAKILFVDNTSYDFLTLFWESGKQASEALKSALANRILKLAFVGDNSRFIGTHVVNNYIGKYANAKIVSGMDLLKTVCVIPKTYTQNTSGGITDLWNATNASLPYAMVKEKIKNGIWLNKENYIVYKGKNDKAEITVKGNSPVMFLTLNNSMGDLVTQSYSGSGSVDKKGGFDQMYLSFLTEDEQYVLADYNAAITSVNPKITSQSIKVYPNPASSEIRITCDQEIQLVCIYDILGNLKFRSNYLGSEANIDIEKLNLVNGYYLVEVRSWDDDRYIQKVMVK